MVEDTNYMSWETRVTKASSTWMSVDHENVCELVREKLKIANIKCKVKRGT